MASAIFLTFRSPLPSTMAIWFACTAAATTAKTIFIHFGGTSASSPAAAGIMALVNQKMGGQRQGVANFVFYRLAMTPGVYHDTTKGDNKVPDVNGQYTVGLFRGDRATISRQVWVRLMSTHWRTTGQQLPARSDQPPRSSWLMDKPCRWCTAHRLPSTSTVQCSGTSCKHPTGEVSLLATSAAGDTAGFWRWSADSRIAQHFEH